MKTAELRAKGQDELKEIIVSSKKELFNLRMQAATGAPVQINRFSQVKKTIARAKTLLNEKPGDAKSAAPKKSAAKKASPKTKKD